jgi:hypothetical protein
MYLISKLYINIHEGLQGSSHVQVLYVCFFRDFECRIAFIQWITLRVVDSSIDTFISNSHQLWDPFSVSRLNLFINYHIGLQGSSYVRKSSMILHTRYNHVYIRMYIYMYTCLYTYTFTYIYANTYTRYIYMWIHIHLSLYPYMLMCICTCMHTFI